MNQIKVKVQLSADNPQKMETNFYPSTKHWGCVDWDELFNQLEQDFLQATLDSSKQEAADRATKKMQVTIAMWEATNSLWVKDLH